jgi:hypothetical protein
MASIIESVQSDLSRQKMDQMRMFIAILATFLQLKDNQMETNKSLQNINHFINLMEEARKKGGDGEMPFEISRYLGDMRPEVQAALDAEGVKYVMMSLADGDYLITDTSERTRQIMNAIRTGTNEIIAGATGKYALDAGVFGQQHSNQKCVTYNDLNVQQISEFKRQAQEKGFQYALSQKDGYYSITVTKDVAERCNLDQFAQECAIFNKSGLYGAYKEFEALQAKQIQEKFREDVRGKKQIDVVYVDLKSPSHFVEVNDTITFHSPSGSKVVARNDVDLEQLESKFTGDSENGISNFVKVSRAEFEQMYKRGPLDADARMKFANSQIAVTETQKHGALVQQIARTAEASPELNVLQAMAKRYEARANNQEEPLPENEKKVLLNFAQAVREDNRVKLQDMLKSGELAAIRGTVESQMIRKAINNSLTAKEFVYGTVMASAERMASSPEVKSTIVANAFNVDKVEGMFNNSDAIASGFATIDNTTLAEEFTDVFVKATTDISRAEIANNFNFMSDVRDTIHQLRMQQTIEGMAEYAKSRGNYALAEELKNTDFETIAVQIAKVAAGAPVEETTLKSITSKAGVEQFMDIFARASMDTMENPLMTIEKLSRHPNVSNHFGSTMFADIMSRAALNDMKVAERVMNRTEVMGKDLATSLDEFNVTGNADRDARSSHDPELGQRDNVGELDF